MRYYQSFPTAIPQCEAGYPRVTHPSATKWFKWIPSEQALQVFGRTTPFDLHVLSTPPAFILSQDQTLKKSLCWFLNDPCHVKTLALPFQNLLFLFGFVQFRIFYNLKNFRGCHHYSVVNVQSRIMDSLSKYQRRRRDLNPRAAINDLLTFQASPFSHLGTSPNNWFDNN